MSCLPFLTIHEFCPKVAQVCSSHNVSDGEILVVDAQIIPFDDEILLVDAIDAELTMLDAETLLSDG